MGGRFWAASSVGLAFLLGGCSTAVGLYHGAEGGAISRASQPLPGMNLPYPNLADVPPAPQKEPALEQMKITQQARGGVSAPAPGALEGLSLPRGAPPVPDVPGISIPPLQTGPAESAGTTAPATAVAPPKPPGPPIAIGFAPGKALLPFAEEPALRDVAQARGDAHVIAGGFGDGSLTLALYRARRLADALTADGVPASAIRLVASAAGSGGFVQLVY